MTDPSPPTELDLEISPSKARHAQRLTTQWNQVTSFLSSLPQPSSSSLSTQSTPPQPPPPPLSTIEHNDATLAYLQDLMHANLTANARRKAQHEAGMEQLAKYEAYANATEDAPERRLLKDVEAALSPEARGVLEGMAEVCVELGCMPPHHPSSAAMEEDGREWSVALARRIVDLTARVFEAERQEGELEALKGRFERELAATRERVEGLRQEVESEDAMAKMEGLRMQTAQFNREAKQVALKMEEYADRIAGLERHVRDLEEEVSLEGLRDQEKRMKQRREEVRRLEERLREFGGLPPDVEASRKEVRRAQGELDLWKRKRDAAFEEVGAG